MKSKNNRQMKQPTLGKRIQELRKSQGITQEELVDLCNVSVRTIQRIEAGEVTPRSHTIKTILQALGEELSSVQGPIDEVSHLDKRTQKTYSRYFKLGWIFGVVFFIISFIEAGISYYRVQEQKLPFDNFTHTTLWLISLTAFTFLMIGFITTGKLYNNYLLKISATIMIFCEIIFTFFDIHSLYFDSISLEYILTAESLIYGALGIVFGLGVLKLKSLGAIAKISGIFEIVTGAFFITVILSLAGLLTLIPTLLFEVIILYKISEQFKVRTINS